MNNKEKILKLTKWQESPCTHPFTCGNSECRGNLTPEEREGEVVLVCYKCNDYVQKSNPIPERIYNIDYEKLELSYRKSIAFIKEGKNLAEQRSIKEPSKRLVKEVIYCGEQMLLICDEKCNKAWGISSRPKKMLSDDPDDYEYLSDDELGIAPIDPETYEGGDAKPTCDKEKMNRWCCRECERSDMLKQDSPLTDLTKRLQNIPKKEKS